MGYKEATAVSDLPEGRWDSKIK